jgi:glutamate-1-semialdehyde 2,1-aminomutase/spore coat polysaccharide biosynthesis protein SpsF
LVVEAVQTQVAQGSVFTLPHPLEVEVAELLCDMVPCAEMVRFAKNGSDVTSAAIRLARAATGRDHILAAGYHGWHDWYAVTTGRPAGVPSILRGLIHPFAYNDITALEGLAESLDGEVAAIILEQPGLDPVDGYLTAVRQLADRIGAVLVFDEIVTGFRFAAGGIQELYGITPDVACVGKAMGNGMPVSALVGRADLMEQLGHVFFSGTFGGEVASLAAAKATLTAVKERDVIGRIWELGRALRDGLQRLISESELEIELLGHPPRSGFTFRVDGAESFELRGLFLQETVRRGVLFGGPIFLTPSHTEADVTHTIAAVTDALEVMDKAVRRGRLADALDGPPPIPAFRPQSPLPSARQRA